MADWTELPLDVAIMIATKFESYKDFTCFGCVCLGWRHAKSIAIASPTLPWKMTWMMIVDHCDKSAISSLRFYQLYKEGSVHEVVNVPKLPLYNESMGRTHCLSTRGWLVHIAETFEDMALIHPVSLEVIHCPPLPPDFIHVLQDRAHKGDTIFNSVVFSLSENPSKSSRYTLAMISRYCNTVAVWCNKDTEWVVQEFPEVIMDINFYKQELYFVTLDGKVIAFTSAQAINLEGPLPTLGWTTWAGIVYLVKSNKSFIVVRQHLEGGFKDGKPDLTTRNFEAWEVNIENGNTKEVTDLGNRALLLGFNSSLLVEAGHPYGCKPNCIYYIGYFSFTKDMGVYELKSGNKIEDHYDPRHSSLNNYAPIWVWALDPC